ncbi:MAG TPA: L-seryl-tRNA(Sec) selenium transferase [Candidatus Binatia bacterium]|nr:L-seryl-tRNA(Sec) selenium transferase [Candidatus Binatia bacterium]
MPAVHRFIDDPRLAAYRRTLGPSLVKSAVTETLDAVRRSLPVGGDAPPYEMLLSRVAHELAGEESRGLVEVINGTGILLHTNLGRAPLAEEAIAAIGTIAGGYSNLEYDLEQGSRGSRYARLSSLLREVSGAQDALVVNNNAAAILLVLDTFAKGREVIVSRNQLIEIGGGFRLPDVLQRSGATLVEVGTTNKVYLDDFARALSPRTALLMRSHTSNYRIEGFVADVDVRSLAQLGRRAGIPTLEDLGSGALVDVSQFGLPREPTVREVVEAGIEMVAFSGDKLLGGPQAGIVVGTSVAISRLRTNPLLRALRVDKATLAALAATLRLYLDDAWRTRVPFYRMLGSSIEELQARAAAIVTRLDRAAVDATVERTIAFTGGGALPLAPIPSVALALVPRAGDPNGLAARLRAQRPPLIGRVEERSVLIDLRTVAPGYDAAVIAAVLAAA